MKDKEKQIDRTDNFEELSDTVSIPNKEKIISISKFEDIKLTIPFKKEVEEMAKILREECFYDLRETSIETSERLATKLLGYYQPKFPENSVVISGLELADYKHYKEYTKSLAMIEKETAEKDFNTIIKALEERKERVKAFYGVAESVGVDIAIRTVKELARQFGVKI